MSAQEIDEQIRRETVSKCYTSFTRQGGNVYPESETEQALRAEIAALQDNAEIGDEYVKAVLEANPNVMWSESPVEIFREMEAENARLREELTRDPREVGNLKFWLNGRPPTSVFDLWRNNPPAEWDDNEAVAAVLDALCNEGIRAWNGDGVGIVVQIIKAQYDRWQKADIEIAALKAQVDVIQRLVRKWRRNGIRRMAVSSPTPNNRLLKAACYYNYGKGQRDCANELDSALVTAPSENGEK